MHWLEGTLKRKHVNLWWTRLEGVGFRVVIFQSESLLFYSEIMDTKSTETSQSGHCIRLKARSGFLDSDKSLFSGDLSNFHNAFRAVNPEQLLKWGIPALNLNDAV